MGGTRTFRALLAASAALLLVQAAFADYPPIITLQLFDPVFRQHQEDIADFYAAEQAQAELPQLRVYSYRVSADTDILSLAAQANVPYEAIATLNRLGTLAPVRKGSLVLLPGTPGVFVPHSPASDLEYLMDSWRKESGGASYDISVKLGAKTVSFTFFPGARFSAEERAFFLTVLFRFPLPVRRETSSFGYRINPVSGHMGMHAGIDLAAPRGTPVYPAREGKVKETGYSEIYGNYILLQHAGDWQTLYGHLNSIAVQLNQTVPYGMILGVVGSTGQSTGPHLHFEIRNRGIARNPDSLLPALKGTR